MAEFLDTARRDIESRLADLRDEVRRLESALAALTDRRAGSGRRRAATRRAGDGRRRRRGRRAGGGTRAAQAERLVKTNPGITISELAKRMGITPNYLYRVMPQLEKDGKVRKRDKGWHPAGG
ncbi:MAG TPA: winged helix-turn-helix transcriptional regulator [Solirubrobacteraceae bacterium]|nr:winged helix-turn-helix transcriptional regulator [Solirubrobacteraceae bacterium]